MTRVLWAQELQLALRKAQSVVEKLAAENDEAALDTRERLKSIVNDMRQVSQTVWNPDEGLFEIR